jgi:hypothetical protein
MLTPSQRAEVEKNLAAAKQCYFDGKISTVAKAARDHGVNSGID